MKLRSSIPQQIKDFDDPIGNFLILANWKMYVGFCHKPVQYKRFQRINLQNTFLTFLNSSSSSFLPFLSSTTDLLVHSHWEKTA